MSQTTEQKTLLIVEDDDALRGRLEVAMKKRGFETCAGSSVAEAKGLIDAQTPDFAIVDLRLLDGSGLDVIAELEKKHRDARAIVLTGYGDIPTAVAAVRHGAVDYVAKPATADEIVDVLMTPPGEATPAPKNPIEPGAARLSHIEHVLHQEGENISRAAHLLNMHRRTLQRVLQRRRMVSDEAR